MMALPRIPDLGLFELDPPYPRSSLWNHSDTNNIKMDLVETPDSYVVTAQTPGVRKDDIRVVFENDTLTVAISQRDERSDTRDHVHFRECVRASSSRSIGFKSGKVDQNKIRAEYKNGQLKITLAFNMDPIKEKHVDIEIH